MTQQLPLSIPTIVAAGVEFLDRNDNIHHPVYPPKDDLYTDKYNTDPVDPKPWFCHIETLRLNQSSTCDCVLGQRFGSYSWGLSKLHVGWVEFAFGFDLGPYDMYAEYACLCEAAKTYHTSAIEQDSWIRDKLFSLLTDEWKRVIAEKQEEYNRKLYTVKK